MKSYDEILEEVAKEKYDAETKEELIIELDRDDLLTFFSEAAERYRAQVELPSDEEIEKHFTKKAYRYLTPNYEVIEWDKVMRIHEEAAKKWWEERIEYIKDMLENVYQHRIDVDTAHKYIVQKFNGDL